MHPNIQHDERLSALRKRLDGRDKKDVSTDTLVKFSELVLKNDIFKFNSKTLKQKEAQQLGQSFLSYSILIMAELEEKLFEKVDKKPYLWWRYIDDIFFMWEHVEEELTNFAEILNKTHPTIHFTSEWSQKSINFFEVTFPLIDSQIETDLCV